MKKHSINILAIIALALSTRSYAQSLDSLTNKTQISFLIGTKIGGASPLPLPVEIRKIKSFSPVHPFFIGVKAQHQVDHHWQISLGLILEGKGMNTKATVKAYKTTFNANDDSNLNMRGYYTGDISTKVHNIYLTIPLQAHYVLSPQWSVAAGPYLSLAVKRKFYGEAFNGYMRNIDPTGERIDIDHAEYDFSTSIRSIDLGFSAGTRYEISKRYYGLAQLDYGFNNIMKTGFESISFGLHNIFMNIGVGIKI